MESVCAMSARDRVTVWLLVMVSSPSTPTRREGTMAVMEMLGRSPTPPHSLKMVLTEYHLLKYHSHLDLLYVHCTGLCKEWLSKETSLCALRLEQGGRVSLWVGRRRRVMLWRERGSVEKMGIELACAGRVNATRRTSCGNTPHMCHHITHVYTCIIITSHVYINVYHIQHVTMRSEGVSSDTCRVLTTHTTT